MCSSIRWEWEGCLFVVQWWFSGSATNVVGSDGEALPEQHEGRSGTSQQILLPSARFLQPDNGWTLAAITGTWLPCLAGECKMSLFSVGERETFLILGYRITSAYPNRSSPASCWCAGWFVCRYDMPNSCGSMSYISWRWKRIFIIVVTGPISSSIRISWSSSSPLPTKLTLLISLLLKHTFSSQWRSFGQVNGARMVFSIRSLDILGDVLRQCFLPEHLLVLFCSVVPCVFMH